MLRLLMSLLLLASIFGCMRGVQEEDLNSWVGQPVSLLDTHPLFMTVPMEKRFSSNGVEIRNYRNGRTVNNCSSTTNFDLDIGYGNTYGNCYQNDIVCNNLFYIKGGKVLKYEPVGRCYTDETVRPRKMI